MKKLFRFCVLVICMSLLTGCLRYNVDMNINKDKSMKLSIIYAMNKSMIEDLMDGHEGTAVRTNDNSADEADDGSTDGADQLESEQGEIISKDDLKELEKAGFTAKDYKEGKYEGVVLTKNIANIDDVTSKEKIDSINMASLIGNGDKVKPAKYYFYKDGEDYVANFVYNNESYEGENELDLASIANTFEITYSVTLPNGSISNNATKVSDDGNTLTWDLDLKKQSTVEYKFNFGGFDILTFVKDNIKLIGGGLLVVLILIILIFNSKRKSGAQVVSEELSDNGVQDSSTEMTSNFEQTPVSSIPTTSAFQTEPVRVESTPVAFAPVTPDSTIEPVKKEVIQEPISMEPTIIDIPTEQDTSTDTTNNNQ